jgi:alpha-beta hydrolase superfamily lysophospholipase
MSDESFSLQELREASKVQLPGLESMPAGDGVTLAYRRYVPASPRAALLFYHGGGAHSGASYQYIGDGLMSQFDTAVYTPDIRGHGGSGGPRGDTPSPKQVWMDISTFIKHIRGEFPRLPLFVGGHSSGAGLMLNYASQPDRESAEGYIFLSPQLGINAKADRPDLSSPFAIVDGSAFAAYGMSGGAAHGHDFAVRFNYPAEILAADPGLVGAITVGMSVALVPSAPDRLFAGLNRPFGLWIGEEDELFVPEKVLAFADLAVNVRADSTAKSIPNAKHLSVLVKAHETIGPWMMQRIDKMKR